MIGQYPCDRSVATRRITDAELIFVSPVLTPRQRESTGLALEADASSGGVRYSSHEHALGGAGPGLAG